MTPPAWISPTESSPVNKVPDITVTFWVVMLLATTVGETTGDVLNAQFGFGLSGTTLVMTAVLLTALGVHLTSRVRSPGMYWATVVLVSIVGTLVTDELVIGLGVSALVACSVFGLLLAGVFLSWARVERTLSVHTIVTARREFFYWTAVLLTFALGTAAGDFLAGSFGAGYAVSAVLFAVGTGVVLGAHRRLGMAPVLAFWSAFVLTRPLGASIGDLVSRDRSDGALGGGSILTSIALLIAIVGVVAHESRRSRAALAR